MGCPSPPFNFPRALRPSPLAFPSFFISTQERRPRFVFFLPRGGIFCPRLSSFFFSVNMVRLVYCFEPIPRFFRSRALFFVRVPQILSCFFQEKTLCVFLSVRSFFNVDWTSCTDPNIRPVRHASCPRGDECALRPPVFFVPSSPYP